MNARLVRTELRRFFARRAIVAALVGALLLAVAVNIALVARSRNDVTYTRTSVEPSVVEQCRDGTHNGLPVVGSRCGSGFFGTTPATTNEPSLTAAYVASGSDHRLSVARTFADTVRGVGFSLTLLVAFLAATFVAADFGTSMATQLLFEPRRRHVYVAKTVAAALGCFAIAVIVLVSCGVLQYAGSAMRGSTAGVDGAWLAHRAGDIGRVAGACAIMAVVAFFLAAVTRRTAGAIGVLFGLIVAMQFLHVRPWTRAIARVVPVNAVWAVVDGQFDFRDRYIGLHTMAGAVTIGVAWVLATTVLGAAWFARREIR